MLVKLTLISWWKLAGSNSAGRDRRIWLWTPAFKNTASRSGYFVTTLGNFMVSLNPPPLLGRFIKSDLLIDKGFQACAVCYVVSNGSSIGGIMFLDEAVEFVLATTYGDDLGTFSYEFIRQAGADPRSGSHEEY